MEPVSRVGLLPGNQKEPALIALLENLILVDMAGNCHGSSRWATIISSLFGMFITVFPLPKYLRIQIATLSPKPCASILM